MKDFISKMDKVIENLKQELAKIRTSRASAGILDGITVSYYGQAVPIKSCATINIPDPKTIEIMPWEANMVPVISSAILKANIGLNPQTSGNKLRLTMPPLTLERRTQLKKIVHNICEDHKISIRNLRRKQLEILDEQEKEKEITKDEKFRAEKDIQKKTDEKIKEIDEIFSKKEKEIMEE
ncbi:MAG: ribosome recycling factor [Elusimicrobia bacterium]|nr:ribosome recycling factor [Elusimicrobiota bacterium]